MICFILSSCIHSIIMVIIEIYIILFLIEFINIRWR
jgi:hypothetical protein